MKTYLTPAELRKIERDKIKRQEEIQRDVKNRTRSKPWQSLKHKLIDRLIKYKPNAVSVTDFLEYCFGVNDRPINAYVVHTRFRINGEYMELAGKIGSPDTYACSKDSIVLIRRDLDKGTFEIELNCSEPITKVFKIDSTEYHRILSYLEPLE
jgi:hypothetical protein